eukprot:TRINITY_DN9263_c0_g1_i1.p1 TRINITY_DN9263_c0_g1~~TRINITY_DN9263_c0_g1_i1.p1  ORF type:complete len:136 (-),score=7.63 TRINITY_DN9263_c0_g1_i1:105-512(-)
MQRCDGRRSSLQACMTTYCGDGLRLVFEIALVAHDRAGNVVFGNPRDSIMPSETAKQTRTGYELGKLATFALRLTVQDLLPIQRLPYRKRKAQHVHLGSMTAISIGSALGLVEIRPSAAAAIIGVQHMVPAVSHT